MLVFMNKLSLKVHVHVLQQNVFLMYSVSPCYTISTAFFRRLYFPLWSWFEGSNTSNRTKQAGEQSIVHLYKLCAACILRRPKGVVCNVFISVPNSVDHTKSMFLRL